MGIETNDHLGLALSRELNLPPGRVIDQLQGFESIEKVTRKYALQFITLNYVKIIVGLLCRESKNHVNNKQERLLIEALSMMRESRLDAAELIYRDLLNEGFKSEKILSNLGMICGATNRLSEAIGYLKQAIIIEPMALNANFNLARAYHLQQNHRQALITYRKCLRIDCNYFAAQFYLAEILAELGEIEIALLEYKKLLKFDQPNSEVYIRIGNIYQQIGDPNNSILYYTTLLEKWPADYKALTNLGIAYRSTGNYNNSLDCFKSALQIKSDFIQPFLHLIDLYLEIKMYTKAKSLIAEKAMIYSDEAEYWNAKGLYFLKCKDFHGAGSCFDKAIKLNPKYAEAVNNFGTVLHQLSNLPRAKNYYQKAIELDHKSTKAFYNLGNTYRENGDFEEAIKFYRKSISIDKNYVEAHLNLSFSLLASGNFAEGWPEYEFRLKSKEFEDLVVSPGLEIWDGFQSESTKIVVCSEQGLGDTLQFMRFIPLLLKKGLDVIFLCQKQLVDLAILSSICPVVVDKIDCAANSDRKWVPLLSIPYLLALNSRSDFEIFDYLICCPRSKKKWFSKIKANHSGKLIIGLNWRGNNQPGADNDYRAIPLELLKPLSTLDNIIFVSLQKGLGSEELLDCSFRDKFVSCQDEISMNLDFVQESGVILNCDLVLTTDTSVVHLAGGLGVKTWLLLTKACDWRWCSDKTGLSSQWYSDIKTFGQTNSGDWTSCISNLINELKDLQDNTLTT